MLTEFSAPTKPPPITAVARYQARCVLSSTARTLESQVRILLGGGMNAIFCVYVAWQESSFKKPHHMSTNNIHEPEKPDQPTSHWAPAPEKLMKAATYSMLKQNP